MSYRLRIGNIPYIALINAATYLREKYNLEKAHVISDLFEKEYNVKIYNTTSFLNFDDDIEFETESAYTFFLLRWT